MRTDSRLSRMLHVLIHLEGRAEPATSERIAEMLNTNPAVVRRTMAGLKSRGYVRSEKGHGGGWTLGTPLDEIRLIDVYTALGEPALFALGVAKDAPQCLVEQAVNSAVGDVLCDAERRVRARLAEITLGELARDFDRRMAARRSADELLVIDHKNGGSAQDGCS